jgi:hypothetical protein
MFPTAVLLFEYYFRRIEGQALLVLHALKQIGIPVLILYLPDTARHTVHLHSAHTAHDRETESESG